MNVEKGLTIYIEDIAKDGGQYDGDISAEVLALTDDVFIRCEHPLHYSLMASLVSEEFLAMGALTLDLSVCCSRCSAFFPLTIEEPAYLFDEQVDKSTESVDLTEDMREAIILAFPSYPVCSDDCKGLCQQCGANMNNVECSCKPPDDDRWAALDGLG
jgi:uncharacterized protein